MTLYLGLKARDARGRRRLGRGLRGGIGRVGGGGELQRRHARLHVGDLGGGGLDLRCVCVVRVRAC